MIVQGREVDVWDKVLRATPERTFSISLCTTCMGRLGDLVRTLPQNLADNADYPDLEFVLLDYHSQDGLEAWVRENMMPHIESGRLVYARTTEPQWFDMAHSRNVAFKLARGEIVCNVDADNWTSPGFAARLNQVANERPTRAVFTKSRQRIRGRVAFYKQEWEELLGGYDETFEGYGHDDIDLMHRALLQGFRLMAFGGEYVSRIKTSQKDKVLNMKEKSWRATEQLNKERSAANLENGILKSNVGRQWGAARLRRNFNEDVVL